MTTKISVVIILIIASLSFSSAGFGQSLILRDATDEIIEVKHTPQRIISLSPSITETLCALGAIDNLIAVTVFCRWPPEVLEKEKIGTVLGPDIEKIIILDPDLVIATVEGNRKQTVEILRRVGIKVFVLGSIQNLEDIYARVETLGNMLSKQKPAAETINYMKNTVRGIRKKTKRKPKSKVFLQLGTEPVVSINKDTLLNELIEIAGGINIARGSPVRYPRYSQEAVVMQNPDVIILVTMGSGSRRADKKWQNFIKNQRTYTVDADLLCNLSPRAIEGLKEIAAAIHPELYKRKE